jgi:DNA-binding transcriptional LysR family regulator
MDELLFARRGRQVRVKLNPVILCNNGDALVAAVRRGTGLAPVPSFLAHGDLLAGRIEPILLDWSPPQYRVFAVYPHRRFVSPKVRVFLEALSARFSDAARDPWWPETLSHAATAMPLTERGPTRRATRS